MQRVKPGKIAAEARRKVALFNLMQHMKTQHDDPARLERHKAEIKIIKTRISGE